VLLAVVTLEYSHVDIVRSSPGAPQTGLAHSNVNLPLSDVVEVEKLTAAPLVFLQVDDVGIVRMQLGAELPI
jgi:hypothetical protein